ncbi:YpoC family protein [Metabacillus malikii]|uniref:YpoC-like domain-containing protein n=1 Tax=Metabacillus malikii TaxID=1504265 RepID=A0ABT9Z959_9BACI|nr:hypothetical protein [Metabacillus malikii]MDQ0228791.1 hypothetical protein [Metabacillus malikii]
MPNIPSTFLNKPFFTERNTFEKLPDSLPVKEIFKKEPLYYEFQGAPQYLPWNNTDETFPLIISLWKGNLQILKISYDTRQKNRDREELLIHSITLFVCGLFWANNKPVQTLKLDDMNISSLPIKPINCEERLGFVLNYYQKYHAFVQLQQLFSELEKVYFKHKAIKSLNERK